MVQIGEAGPGWPWALLGMLACSQRRAGQGGTKGEGGSITPPPPSSSLVSRLKGRQFVLQNPRCIAPHPPQTASKISACTFWLLFPCLSHGIKRF